MNRVVYEEIDENEYEHYSREGMVCPWCGYIHEFMDFEVSSYYGDGEFKCIICGKKFNSSCYTSYSWTTKKVED